MPVLPPVPSTTVPPGLMLSSQRIDCLARMTLRMYSQSLLLGVTHGANSSTILDAPPGVLEFGFCEDLTSRPFREGL